MKAPAILLLKNVKCMRCILSYYYCYSYPLKNYLVEQGEHFIASGLHEKSLNKFWLFKRTQRLDDLLNEWANRKQIKDG